MSETPTARLYATPSTDAKLAALFVLTYSSHENVAETPRLPRSPWLKPRLAVLNQQPHEPVRMRNGSAAPVSAM
jgi:hypothetical protein